MDNLLKVDIVGSRWKGKGNTKGLHDEKKL